MQRIENPEELKKGNEIIDQVKNALKEKLARKKLAGTKSPVPVFSQPYGNVRLGFGGRVINDERVLALLESSQLQSVEDLPTFISKGGCSSAQVPLGQFPRSSHQSDTPSQVEETPHPEIILDYQRRTMMTPKAVKAKIKRMKKAAEHTRALKEQKRLQLKARQKIQKLMRNKASTDDCDRILLKSVVYAVIEHGRRLVPLLDPDSDTSEYLVWNNWRYFRCPNGNFKRNVKMKVKSLCRYFSRNGMLIDVRR